MATLGIVIPSYNAERTLRRAVESVLAQTFQDWELIVVDDGSEAFQSEIIKDFLGDPRIKFLRLERNSGAATARNAGIKGARSEWIAFLDADDEWLPDKLARQFYFIRNAGKRINLCATGFIYKKYLDGVLISETCRIPKHESSYRKVVFGCDISPGSTLMVRRTVFDEIGYLSPELSRFEDWDWLIRYNLQGGHLAIVAEPISIIYNRTWPSLKDVRESGKKLSQRQLRGISDRSFFDGLRFRSSLMLEYCISARREKKGLSALGFAIASTVLWPPRLASVAWRQINSNQSSNCQSL